MLKLLLATLLLGCSCAAQQGYTFNRISTDDGSGLSSNEVYCTYQDERGYVWVGTANGLQRFDGNKFVTFSQRSPGRRNLPLSDLVQILPAGNGRLWLLFAEKQEAGIYDPVHFLYEPATINTGTPNTPRNEMRLWKDSRNNIYLHLWKYGLLRYNQATHSFSDANPFKLPPGWIPYRNIFEDTIRRQIWLPCPDSGLAVYDERTGIISTSRNNSLRIPLLNRPTIQKGVSEFFIDSRRRYWVFNWNETQQKHCFDEQGNPLPDTAGVNANPEYSELRSFFESREKVLWVYGANGLFSADPDNRRFYFYTPGAAAIPYRRIYHIMQDRDGGTWIATDNGIYFAIPGSGSRGVMNKLIDESDGGLEITDILQEASGQFWLTTWGQGVRCLDAAFNPIPSPVNNAMPPMDATSRSQYRQSWAIYQHTDSKIWIGCQAGKYIVYDPATGKAVFSSIPEAEGSTIRYITRNSKGVIWLATQQGHIIRYDGQQFKAVQVFHTIVNKILVDKQDHLWLSTLNEGLICLGADGIALLRQYTAGNGPNDLFAGNGADIDFVNDSTIAYGSGALHLVNSNTGTIRQLRFEDGLPGNSIKRIRADRNGDLWIITRNGLCKYNPRNNRFTLYGRRDGITLAGIANSADLQAADGKIVFAGGNALMHFEPAVFENRQPPQNVVITDFKLFNEYLPVDSLLALPQVNLSAGQHSVTIYFAALSYLQNEKLAFYYKLSGIDADWVRADRQNFVNYPLLPPGPYTFSVYCENIEGLRSPAITHFKIYIKPPFWKTYWFASTVLFVLLLVIYLLHRTRVNRLMAVEQIRTRVARDLHDDMGSTLSTINILSTMAKSKLQSDVVKTSEYIGKISENSQRMMEAMDDIVWSIKPMNDSMQKITARMREFATSVLEAKNMEVVFTIPEPVYDIKLNMEARRDFFLVYKEAINNAAKYSGASLVEVILGLQQGKLILEVRDNGKGFDPLTADAGNGLTNMQKRAEAMDGKLQLLSKPGEGTNVIVTLPIR